MPTPTDPHARRVAALSAAIALTALMVAALVIHRLDATRAALQTAKASCSGLVRASLEDGAPAGSLPGTSVDDNPDDGDGDGDGDGDDDGDSDSASASAGDSST